MWRRRQPWWLCFDSGWWYPCSWFFVFKLLYESLVNILILSQIDSLDMLALLGDRERFTSSVDWIGKNLRFDIVSKHLLWWFELTCFDTFDRNNLLTGINAFLYWNLHHRNYKPCYPSYHFGRAINWLSFWSYKTYVCSYQKTSYLIFIFYFFDSVIMFPE